MGLSFKSQTWLIGLGLCLVFSACPSDRSSSASDRASGQGRDSTLGRKADFLGGLLGGRHTASRVLEALMSALPDRVWLNEVAFDPEGVRVNGNALTNNLLADYVSRLDQTPGLTGVSLISSVQKKSRFREYQEFEIRALAPDPGSAPAAAGVPLADRLKDLEQALPAREETAEMLRELQRLALDSGLRMTRLAPGTEVRGEFAGAWPVSIEVTGARAGLGRFLRGLAESRRLWIAERFSFKAVSGEDPRSQVRASVTAKTYLPPGT